MAKIEIYTTPTCGFCMAAKRLLNEKGQEFDEIDVARTPARRREMMDRANGRYTVPQIFIDGRHLGGCDELYSIERSGQLDPLLEA